MRAMEWLRQLPKQSSKKPLPLLSFPSVSLLGVSVAEITKNAELQAKGMKAVADKVDSAASVGMMDLSVEAEAFGCQIKKSENEVPTVIGTLVSSEDEVDALRVPSVGEGRTGVYVEAARLAAQWITDRPVFAGIIGPFSLAGRLMDVSEALVNCLAEPEFVAPNGVKYTQSVDGKRLYVHLFDYPFQFLELPNLAGKVDYAQFLNDCSELLYTEGKVEHFSEGASDEDGLLVLRLPIVKPPMVVPVIELFLK